MEISPTDDPCHRGAAEKGQTIINVTPLRQIGCQFPAANS